MGKFAPTFLFLIFNNNTTTQQLFKKIIDVKQKFLIVAAGCPLDLI